MGEGIPEEGTLGRGIRGGTLGEGIPGETGEGTLGRGHRGRDIGGGDTRGDPGGDTGEETPGRRGHWGGWLAQLTKKLQLSSQSDMWSVQQPLQWKKPSGV